MTIHQQNDPRATTELMTTELSDHEMQRTCGGDQAHSSWSDLIVFGMGGVKTTTADRRITIGAAQMITVGAVQST